MSNLTNNAKMQIKTKIRPLPDIVLAKVKGNEQTRFLYSLPHTLLHTTSSILEAIFLIFMLVLAFSL